MTRDARPLMRSTPVPSTRWQVLTALWLGLWLVLTAWTAAVSASPAAAGQVAGRASREEDPVRRLTWDYGQGTPELSCSLTKPCAVWLEPGEVPGGTPSGDTVRWEVTQQTIGNQTIVFLKPRHCDLEGTVLWLPTSTAAGRVRLYALALRSECQDDTAWNPSVGYGTTELRYRYPLEWALDRARLEAQVEEAEAEEARSLAETREPFEVENLDLSYEWTPRAPWAPVQVFGYGTETYLRFPDDQPRPLIWDRSSGKREMVTTTERGAYVVVPRPLERFELVGPRGRRLKVRQSPTRSKAMIR